MDLKSKLKQARDAIKNKDYETALNTSKTILKEDKSNYLALIFLGISLQEIGPNDQAPKAFRKAIQCDDTNILGWNGLASYYEKSDSNDSKRELTQVYFKLLQLESNETKLLEILKRIPALPYDHKNIIQLFGLLENTKINAAQIYEVIIDCAEKCSDCPEDIYNIYKKSFRCLIEIQKGAIRTTILNFMEFLYKFNRNDIKCEADIISDLNVDEILPLMEWICKAFNELYIEEQQKFDIAYIEMIESKAQVLTKEMLECLPARLTIAISQLAKGSYLNALGNGQKAIKLNKTYVYTHILLASINIKLRFYKDGINSAFEALKVVGSNETLRSLINKKLFHCYANSSDSVDWDACLKNSSEILQQNECQSILCNLTQCYINKKVFDEAQKLMEKLDSENKKTLMVKLLKAKGKFSEALELVEKDNFSEIGELYWLSGQCDKCLVPFLKAAKSEPESYLSFLNLGNYYAKFGDLSKAERCYEKTFKINPNCSEACIELSKIYRIQNKSDKNLLLLNNFASDKITKEDRWAYLQMGIQYLEQGDYNNAIEKLRFVIRVDPENSHCWESLADAYFARGSYTSSMKSYEKVIELKPQSIYPLLQIGYLKKILGEFSEGKTSFINVLNLSNSYVPALKGYAETCLLQARQFFRQQLNGLARDALQDGIDTISKALEKDASLSCLWKIGGDSLVLAADLPEKYSCLMLPDALAEGKRGKGFAVVEQLNLFALAARFYIKAISLTTENILIYHDLANSYLSHAKKLEKDESRSELLQKAMNVIQFCISNNPTHWQHWNILGNIAFIKEPQDLALSQHAFIKAVTLEKNSAVAWTNLGTIYLYLNQMKLANNAFSQAQRGDPNYVNSWIGQALIAEMSGHEDAMDLFRHSTQVGWHQEGSLGYAYWVCHTLLDSKPNEVIYSIHNMHAIPVASDALNWYTEHVRTNSCAWTMLGLLKERMGLKQSAAQSYRMARSTSLKKHRNVTDINYGRSVLNIEKYSEAINVLKSAQESTLTSVTSLALALFKTKQYEESYETYESALHWLAEKKESQSDILVALATMAYLFQGSDAAKTLLFQSTQLKSESHWDLFATLSLGLIDNDLNLANLVLRELEPFKDHKLTLPHYGILLAYTCLLQKQKKRAISELSKLIHRHPEQASLWLSLSTVLLRSYERKMPIGIGAKCASAALVLGQAHMDVAQVFCIIALSLLLSGEHKRGLKAAQKAIHCYPEIAECWSLLIYALSQQKVGTAKQLSATVDHIRRNLKPTENMTKWLQCIKL